MSGNRYIEAPPSVSTVVATGCAVEVDAGMVAGTFPPIEGIAMTRAVVAPPASKAAIVGFVLNMCFSEGRVSRGRASAGGGE